MIFRIFICILHHLRAVPYITDEATKDPAPNWLDSLVGRELHRYHRGHGFESFKAWIFFRLLFHNCLSCVYNCDIKSCLHIFLGDSNVWSFINSFVCNSVISNRCRMQRKCVVRGSSNTAPFNTSISMKLAPEKDERSIYMQKNLQRATRYRGNFTYTTPITVLTIPLVLWWVIHPQILGKWMNSVEWIMKILPLEDFNINQISLYSCTYVCGEIVRACCYWEKENVGRWNECVRGNKL